MTSSLKSYRSAQKAREDSLKNGGYPEALLRIGVSSGQRRIGSDARGVQDPIADFWERPKIPITRYGNGSFPVLYCSEAKVTALREVCSWFYTTHAKHSSKPLPTIKEMLLYTVDIDGKSLDLRGQHKTEPRLVHPTKYGYCHDLAEDARKTVSFIQAPSARDFKGVCYPVFSHNSAVWCKVYDTVIMQLPAKSNVYEAKVNHRKETIDIHDVYASVV